YVDQGEELYVRAEERQRQRFSQVIAPGVADPRLYMLMSMRADFLGELQKDEPLFKVHRKIDIPPLREAELHKVVSRPAELLSAARVAARRRIPREDGAPHRRASPSASTCRQAVMIQCRRRRNGRPGAVCPSSTYKTAVARRPRP